MTGLTLQHVEQVEAAGAFLAQAGVKGMKWGVRNDNDHVGEKTKTKKIDKLDKKFEKNASTLSTTIALHNAAAEKTNKVDVDRINNKPEYKNADFSRDSPLRQKYYKEHQKAFLDNLEAAAKEMGTNASGTKEYRIVEHDDSWDVYVADVKHADGQIGRLKPHFDAKGHLSKLEPVDFEMSQSDLDSAEDFLAQAGVKGMKWGQKSAMERVEKRSAMGLAAVERSGGSKAKANTKAIAKRVGIDAVLTVGANLTMGALKDNPKARLAVAAGAVLLKAINMQQGVNEVRGISSQPKS